MTSHFFPVWEQQHVGKPFFWSSPFPFCFGDFLSSFSFPLLSVLRKNWIRFLFLIPFSNYCPWKISLLAFISSFPTFSNREILRAHHFPLEKACCMKWKYVLPQIMCKRSRYGLPWKRVLLWRIIFFLLACHSELITRSDCMLGLPTHTNDKRCEADNLPDMTQLLRITYALLWYPVSWAQEGGKESLNAWVGFFSPSFSGKWVWVIISLLQPPFPEHF